MLSKRQREDGKVGRREEEKKERRKERRLRDYTSHLRSLSLLLNMDKDTKRKGKQSLRPLFNTDGKVH